MISSGIVCPLVWMCACFLTAVIILQSHTDMALFSWSLPGACVQSPPLPTPYGIVGGTTATSGREAPTMTEAQARAKLRKLLAVTLERGAAPGEQASATCAIGAILQEYPNLRDMIIGVEDMAASHRPSAGVWPQES